MKDIITRRALLKGLAAFPLIAAPAPFVRAFCQGPKASPRTSMSTLYLCCHGLFAFVFYDDHIAIITPDVDDHAYKAGAWKKEARLTKGEVYSLVGANDPDHPNPRPALDKDNLFLSGLKNIDLDRSFCELNVPFPDEFISLRHVP